MKNDTIVSVIICYDFYDNDNDVFFILWRFQMCYIQCSCMSYTHLNIVV